MEFATLTLAPPSTTSTTGQPQPIAKIYRPSELDEVLRELDLGGTKDEQLGAGEGTGGGGGRESGNVAIST